MIVELPSFAERLQQAVRERAGQIADEEIAAFLERVKERVSREMDALALQLLGYYDVQRDTDRLVITVKKPDTKGVPNGK